MSPTVLSPFITELQRRLVAVLLPFMLTLLAALSLLALPAQAAITYVGQAKNGAASGNLSIIPPSGTAGDVLVATIAVRPYQRTISTPSGWTLVVESTNINDVTMRMITFTRVTTAASEGASSWTIGGGAHTGVAGGIVRFSGVDGASPVNRSAANVMGYSSFSIQANGVTPGVANTMLVTSHAFTSAPASWTPPGGMTEALEAASEGVPSTGGMGMEMNYQPLATATATGARSATAASGGTDTGYGIGHTLALTPGSTACTYLYTDNFDRASLGADWGVTVSDGSFTPALVSNRLRMTNLTSNSATSVHLNRFFPAAGNKVVIEFDNIAYGGNGADGVALTVSDASIIPSAGAFGGSLGYAQRTGVNGFAGGWLGIGFDEFGNFPNPTEGRVGGPGVIADSVTIRGSYTGTTPGTSGYAFHRNSGALSPGVDVAAGSGTISYVGKGNAGIADSGNVTPTLPGHQTNDLLICAVTSNDNISHAVAGWNQLYQQAQTSNYHPRSSLWWKWAASAAEASPTVTHSGGSGIVSRCTAFRGVDLSTPFDASYASNDNTNSSTTSTGSLTTVTANAMMLFVGHINNDRCSMSTSVTGGLSWSESFCEENNPSGGSNDETVALHYASKAATGAIGPIAFTTSGNDESRGVLIALRPASLTPTGHRYRITIDHSNGVNAYVSVERDITGSGSSYGTIIAQYDAKAQSGQGNLPPNFFLSYTGSTGGSNNIHEIDNLRICAAQPITTPTLHHIRLLHDGSGTPGTGETVTINACANADCSLLYLGDVSFDLNVTGDQTWSADPRTFAGGSATVTLGKPTAGVLTLGGIATSPTGAGATRCFNGGTETCTFTFGSTGFDAVEPGGAVGSPIFLKLANVAFTTQVLATSGSNINTGYTGTVLVDLVNPDAASGNCNDTNAGLTSASTHTFVGGDNGRRAFSFTYTQAASKVKVRIRTNPATTVHCSADNFAIRPQLFSLAATLPTSPKVLAGTAFTLTAAPGVTTGYTGTPAIETALITNQAAAAISGGALAGGFTAASGGNAVATLKYHDVGTLTFGINAVNDGNFSAVDQNKTPAHCVANSTSNTLVSGLYGCVIGSGASSAIGRFIPAYFDTKVEPQCPTSFVFSRQPFHVTVTAKSIDGITTPGYSGVPGLANNVTLLDGNTVTTGALTNTTVASSVFVAGEGKVTTPTFSFTTEPVAPTTILLRATESGGDGVTSNVSTTTYLVHEEGEVDIRSGRLAIANAFGAAQLPLAMSPAQVQYYNATSRWVNDNNECTSVPVPTAANGGLSFAGGVTSALAAAWVGTGQPATTSTSNGALSGVQIGAPTLLSGAVVGPGASGFVTLNLTSMSGWPAWLPPSTPAARLSFGLYNESRRIIYRREVR